MDVIITPAVSSPVSTESEIAVDRFLALIFGRYETFSNPQGKPSFDVIQVSNLNDLIRQGVGFHDTLTNEYGHPEPIRVAYSEPGTLPETFLRNFQPERLPEIVTNPVDAGALPILKRVFAKEAALSGFAMHLGGLRGAPLPPNFASRAHDELTRVDLLIGLIDEVLGKFTLETPAIQF